LNSSFFKIFSRTRDNSYFVAIILLLGLSFLHCTGGNDPDNEALPKFGIYMPVDTTITYEKLQTMNLDTVRIKKWLTDDMIDYYDYSSHLIYLKVDKLSFFPESQWPLLGFSHYHAFWQQKRIPFIILGEAVRIYAGVFTHNRTFQKPTPYISGREASSVADDVIKIALYDIELSNTEYNLAKDVRSSSQIGEALKSAGIFSGGIEFKIDDVKIIGGDTLEVSATVKNNDRNNLYIFNLKNTNIITSKPLPTVILVKKDQLSGYKYYFNNIISSGFTGASDEYFRLEKGKSINLKFIAVSPQNAISNDYFLYCDFHGESYQFNQDKRIKSDGRVWMGKTRSNYMDITYDSTTGITIKNKDYKFE